MFEISGKSELGKRVNNEDAIGYYTCENCMIAIVADGVGGSDYGEKASRICVDIIINELKDKEIDEKSIEAAVKKANDEIIKQQAFFSGMKTTMVGLFAFGESIYCAHVGDSRLYQFRDNEFVFRTLDHSVPQVLANAGVITDDEIRFHEDRNKIRRSLGIISELIVDISEINAEKKDVFLLASDGFWEHFSNAELSDCTSMPFENWLSEKINKIESDMYEEQDNYSIIICGVKDE